MSRYTPLSEPLVATIPESRLRACVIIPARNEEAILPRTLDALRRQHDLDHRPLDPDTYEVILLLNNCTDASQQVAARYQEQHPTFRLHVVSRTLPQEQAHVGTARRLLMDTAHHRLQSSVHSYSAILSTDADTVVAPDWIARCLAAIEDGADVVGGVIHLFPEDLKALQDRNPGCYAAYCNDRRFQSLVAHLESLLDPDPADPWPRHLEHFGASIACTPSIYALAGGLPPIKPLEDVAFVDALRKVGARIRHCPETHIFTSARLDGRAEVGLSGQLRIWEQQSESNEPHIVDSAQWLEHRFRSLASLRRLNESQRLPVLTSYPEHWQERIASLQADRLPTARFLELLDCDALIEELFTRTGQPHHSEIKQSISDLSKMIERASISEVPVDFCPVSDKAVFSE